MSRVLHAALMPFPSPQGTQGAVAAMMRALREGGVDATLFVHPHSDGTRTDLRIVRSPTAPFGKSLRSGPSVGRALLDALAVPVLARTGPGTPLFAHNVEAGLAARLTRRPYVYVAHTRMARELPFYTRYGREALAPLGRLLDASAVAPCALIAAISPQLVRDLARDFERDVAYLPVPWTLEERATADATRRERASLGLDLHALVLGYTGNLDGYQGTELLLPTLAAVRARTRAALVLATESDPEPLLADARRAGLAAHVRVLPLRDEADRARAHALFDVTLVPRTCEGGVPMKLLDSLARGVPVIAADGATAGLPCGRAVLVTRASPDSFAAACQLAAAPASREALAEAGIAYVTAHHAPARFREAHEALRIRLEACARRT